MNTRLWIGALVVALSCLSSLTAQPDRRSRIFTPEGGAAMSAIDPIPGDRPSHLPVNKGLEDERSPERLLAERLGHSRAMQQLEEVLEKQKFNEELQRLARRLLEDPKFLESLRDKFSPQDLERLLGKLNQSEGWTDDPKLTELFRQGLAGKQLSANERDLLGRWAEKFKEKDRPTPDGGPTPPAPPADPGKPVPPPDGQPPAATEPPAAQLPWDRLPEGSSDWFKKNLDGLVRDLDRWIDTPSGQSWRDTLKGWAQRVAEQPRNPALTEPIRRFRSVLPRLSDLFPGVQPPRLVTPNLPRFGSLPSAPRLSPPSLAGSGRFVTVVVLLAGLGFLIWMSAKWWKLSQGGIARGWHLGPWPVPPAEVSTRGDLVRAFEYLAVWCLGPAARTCHHLELGQRIGAVPVLDAERRREAAVELTRLYEQARYTPDEEPLAPEDMARARRELCYLAGVPAA